MAAVGETARLVTMVSFCLFTRSCFPSILVLGLLILHIFSYGYDYIIFFWPRLKSPVMRNDLAHIVRILLCMLQILSCAIFVDISHSSTSSPQILKTFPTLSKSGKLETYFMLPKTSLKPINLLSNDIKRPPTPDNSRLPYGLATPKHKPYFSLCSLRLLTVPSFCDRH